eukprot:g9087.t1
MEFFVIQTIKRIKGLSSRKHKELRLACDATTKAIEEKKHGTKSNSNTHVPDADADKYFLPFQLACKTNNSKMISAALDCMQKLIAYGYLAGETLVTNKSNGEIRKLIDVVVETICSCNGHTDENVQLQVIKALLTTVSCNHCEIHETSLLLAVRACYHIHLVSRNSVNRTTAKGTLQQMLNICFQKMEMYEENQEGTQFVSGAMEKKSACNSTSEQLSNSALLKTNSNSSVSSRDTVLRARRVLLWENKVDYQKSISWRAGPNMYPHVYITLGYTSVGHDMADLDLYEEVTSFGANNRANPSGNSTEMNMKSSSLSHDNRTPNDPFRSLFHKDAFLLFRSLCKLSMKSNLQNIGVDVDPVALQTKLLSLELIRGVLENAGPVFRSGPKFIYAVKHYLCESLIKNCVSSNTLVVNLSLRIFVALISHFRDFLRSEIEVFVSTIFLRILEEESSDVQHRLLVLEVFYKLCQDGHTIVELFINYDCGMGIVEDEVSTDQGLFERIVNVLSEMSKKYNFTEMEKPEMALRQKLHMLALQSVVALSRCLADFTEDTATKIPSQTAQNIKADDSLEKNATKKAALSNIENASLSQLKECNDNHDVKKSAKTVKSFTIAMESFDKKQKTKKEIESGIEQFNRNPKVGLRFLLDCGHIEKKEDAKNEPKLHERGKPASVSKFLLKYCEGTKVPLDKTVIGDYLGEGKEYNLMVLHCYVDLLEFTGMEIDEAIRKFLSGFRLPGEAQKIDRMMEKFAERYCELNKGVFASADTAFVLSYSIIMLQTDLHNPNIKSEKKMKKDEFLRNNRGIASGQDLSPEFLGGIYDRIKATPITLKEDRTKRDNVNPDQRVFSGVAGNSSRRIAARKLQADIEKQAVDRMRRRPSMTRALRTGDSTLGGDAFYTMATLSDVQTKDHIRPMFTVAWLQFISVFDDLLSRGEEEETVTLSLEGIEFGVKIANVFRMQDARRLYIQTLARYTNLDRPGLLDMKNIECIRVLLKITLEEGEHLRLCWEEVLSVMSSLARYELLATTPTLGDERFFQPSGNSHRSGKNLKPSRYSAFSSKSQKQRRLKESIEQARIIDKSNAFNIVKFVDLKIIERVFNLSVNFTEEGIVSFVTSLCEVAKIELLGADNSSATDTQETFNDAPPRVFCLQKLVEVASYNMETRTRIVWSQLWRHLSNLFTEVGVHKNPSVAMYAIDSLKQLSMKFLEKTELSHFNFQSVFLIPFERIMSKSPTLEIKELILRVIDNITQAKVQNIMSGWRAIFSVYALAGSDKHESLNAMAYDAVDRIFLNHWNVTKESFVDLVNCLTIFAKNKIFLRTASLAINTIHAAAKKIVAERKAERHSLKDKAATLFDDSKKDTAIWWPILTGLANLTMDDRHKIRDLAMKALFNILNEEGHYFSSGLWELVFKGVLFPIFDDVQHSHEHSNSGKVVKIQDEDVDSIVDNDKLIDKKVDAWLRSTCQEALNGVVSLFFKKDSFVLLQFLFGDLLQLLENCIVHPNQVLARKGVSCLKTLVLSTGNHFDFSTWNVTSKKMYEICKRTIPRQLKWTGRPNDEENCAPSGVHGASLNALQFSPRQVLSMCYVQLDMVNVIEDVVREHWNNISPDNIILWLKMLEEIFSFAKGFNDNINHRIHLLNAGFMKRINGKTNDNQLQERPPSLLNQESQAILVYLGILFRLVSCERVELKSLIGYADIELEKHCSAFIQRYIRSESEILSDTKIGSIEHAERVRLGLVFGPMVIDILKFWRNIPSSIFDKHSLWLKPLLFDMVESKNTKLRKELKELFVSQLL